MKLWKEIFEDLRTWLKQHRPKAYLPLVLGVLLIFIYTTVDPWRIDIIAYFGTFLVASGITLMITGPLTESPQDEMDDGDSGPVKLEPQEWLLVLLIGAMSLPTIAKGLITVIPPGPEQALINGSTPTPTATFTPTPTPSSTPTPTHTPSPTPDPCLPENFSTSIGEVINHGNIADLRERLRNNLNGMILGLAPSGTGEDFIVVSETNICIYNIYTICKTQYLNPKRCYEIEAQARKADFNQDGKLIAVTTSEGLIKLLDENGETKQIIRLDNSNRATAIAFSSTNPILLGAGDSTGHIHLWLTYGSFRGKQTEFKAHQSSVLSLVFSPDGDYLVSGGKDNTAYLWDISDISARPELEEATVLEGNSGYITALAFYLKEEGNWIVTGSDDGIIQILQESREKESSWEGHLSLHTGTAVQSVAFSPDGELLAQGGADGTITIWSTKGGRKLTVLQGHESAVTEVKFIFKGRLIASASKDNTLRVWGTRELLGVKRP